MEIEFSKQILKNIRISNLMKLRLVGTQYLNADRRKDERTGGQIWRS
jgi:hypothetical protein